MSAILTIPHSREHGFYTLIAKSSNYSRQHVAKVLQGKANYSTRSLGAIAKACNVDSGWLVDYIERVKDSRVKTEVKTEVKVRGIVS